MTKRSFAAEDSMLEGLDLDSKKCAHGTDAQKERKHLEQGRQLCAVSYICRTVALLSVDKILLATE